MSAESPPKDLYSILGARPPDSLQQLKHKYKQLALMYHPDRLGGLCSSEAALGLRRFLEAEEAWRILGDPVSRRDYDLQRKANELRQVWPMDSLISVEDMTFDPDNLAFTYACRCGGEFHITEEEIGSERGVEERKKDEDDSRGVVVCCDTCSLSVCITGMRTRCSL